MLDVSYKGEAEAYMEITGVSKEEAENIFADNLDATMEGFETTAMPEELKPRYRELFAELAESVSYTVEEPERQEDGSYTVNVMVKPITLFSDTYDTEFTRAAVYAGKLDIEDEMNRIGIFTISFSCKPFRYAVAGAKSQLVGNGQNLTNPYSFPSQPIIRVVGSGKGTLTIQSESSNATWEFTDIDEFVEIDSEQMNCYKNNEPKNDTVGGNGFPILYPGENTFSFTGGIQGISVTPRWCSI